MAATHRKRRIAADEAHAWARNLRLKNSLGKLVLCMVTGYVDGEGVCFVGIEALSEDTELSADTVRKRLAWLEGVGAIARFPQWIDANGRRNGDGRGRRTSDEIRLLMDADPEVIEARAAGEEDAASDPRSQQGSDEAAPGPAPLPAPERPSGWPSDSGKGLDSSEPEPEPECNPPTPQGGSGAAEPELGSEGQAWPGSETWPDFEAAYGEPILRQSIARQVWSALSEDERALAIKAAKGYGVHRRTQRKPPNVLNAHTFLRERAAWAAFAALAPLPPPAPKPRTMVAAGSQEFVALALCRAIARRPMLEFGPAEIPGPVPAGAAGLAALVRFKPGTNDVDQSGWTIADKGSPRYNAWLERAREWLGFWPEDHRYWLDEQGNIVANATLAFKAPGKLVPRCRDGLLMPPLDWPPAKSATGPPLHKSA